MEKTAQKKYKDVLLSEKNKLEEELKTVGRINPDNPNDWEPVPEKMDTMRADNNEVADTIEEFEENTAILRELEIRLNNVKRALEKIELGTFGKCEVGGEEIPEDRLGANPAAMTCIAHADELRPH